MSVQLAASGVVFDYPATGSRGGRVRALDGVSVAVTAGEPVAVMGPSGSGKSTLAMVLAGVLRPGSGHVARPARVGRTTGVALVLQRPEGALFAETVAEEVGVASRLRGGSSEHVRADVAWALGCVGFDDAFSRRDPFALSGGEQRRVAIAAALAARPRVLLLDEPGAGLDAAARWSVHEALRELAAQGVTVVVVTHDAAEAAALCPRLVVLVGGRVAYDGPTADVLGVPARAGQLGLGVPPAVELAHAVGAHGGAQPPRTVDEPQLVTWVAEQLAARRSGPPSAVQVMPSGDAPRSQPAQPPASPRGNVARRVPGPDPRARLLVAAVLVLGVFVAGSLAGVLVVFVAAVALLAAWRVQSAQVLVAVRPLVLVLALLFVAQAVAGGSPDVELWRGKELESGVASAALRTVQLFTVVLATLAATASVAAVDLAAALRSLMRPLRVVGVPVEEVALTLGLGLGFAPTLAAELATLQRAQRARGLTGGSSPAMALRLQAMLFVPLVVLAFRRAGTLADAMRIRGFTRGGERTRFRPPTLRARDGVAVALAVLVVALAIVV